MSFGGGGGGGSGSISGSTDVVLSNPSTGQYMGYNGATAKWNNMTLSGGGSVTSTNITDSTATGRSILTAANAAAVRTIVGLATTVSGSVNGTATALTLWTGTQAQYDALGSYSSTTVYVVT